MAMFFVVCRRRGPDWDPTLSLEEQSDWPAHADFMDGLVATGFVVLGGPLADEETVVLARRGGVGGRGARDACARSVERVPPRRRHGSIIGRSGSTAGRTRHHHRSRRRDCVRLSRPKTRRSPGRGRTAASPRRLTGRRPSARGLAMLPVNVMAGLGPALTLGPFGRAARSAPPLAPRGGARESRRESAPPRACNPARTARTLLRAGCRRALPPWRRAPVRPRSPLPAPRSAADRLPWAAESGPCHRRR